MEGKIMDNISAYFCKLWGEAKPVEYSDIINALKGIHAFINEETAEIDVEHLAELLVSTYKKWSKLNEEINALMINVAEISDPETIDMYGNYYGADNEFDEEDI